MKSRLPLVLVVLCAIVATGIQLLWKAEPRFDYTALMIANVAMLVLSLIGWALQRRTLNDRPQAFIRGVYSATLLRLFVCLIGIMTYALANRGTIYKPTVAVMGGIYFVYVIVESLIVSQTAKRNGREGNAA
jgi:hypothetical protein